MEFCSEETKATIAELRQKSGEELKTSAEATQKKVQELSDAFEAKVMELSETYERLMEENQAETKKVMEESNFKWTQIIMKEKGIDFSPMGDDFEDDSMEGEL